MSAHNIEHIIQNPVFEFISQAANQLGTEAYVVGGYVRDYLMGRRLPSDIDVVCIGSGIALAQAFAQITGNQKEVTVFKNFGTAMVRYQGLDVEFVGARKESYRSDSRKPLVEEGTLMDDQLRRDFTINALAVGLNGNIRGKLIDSFGGVQDIENKILKTPQEPSITFSDDPLRMMRAIRFASQLQFEIASETLKGITEKADRINIISVERISEELHKIMLSPKPSTGLALLFKTELLPYFLKEVSDLQGVEEIQGQGHKDNFYHTLQVVDNISENTQNLWLRYAALFHDIGKPASKRFDAEVGWTFHGHEMLGSKMVKKIFNRMKWPLGEPLKYVQKIVSMSSRPIAITNENATDSAGRRLLFDAGEDIDDLMLLCEADITTKNKTKKQKFLENFKQVRFRLKEIEASDHLRNWQPPITGEEIMTTFNLKPSREVGILKEAIKEAILEGLITNNYHDAQAFMMRKASELGLNPQIDT